MKYIYRTNMVTRRLKKYNRIKEGIKQTWQISDFGIDSRNGWQ